VAGNRQRKKQASGKFQQCSVVEMRKRLKTRLKLKQGKRAKKTIKKKIKNVRSDLKKIEKEQN